jgi:hypothetical protein
MTVVGSYLEVLEGQNGCEKLEKACSPRIKAPGSKHHPERYFLELLTAVHLRYIRV